MRVRCLQHAAFEGPGAIEEWARSRGHGLTCVSAEGGPTPQAPFDMLVVLGGPMGAEDEAEYPWLTSEKALIARAVEDGALVLGICLGAQLLASSLGGRVSRGPGPEIGWFPVSLTAAGRGEHVFRGWPSTFVAGHWHGDVFDPPSGVPVAAVSDACASQAFAAAGGRAVGLQFHLEWTEGSLRELVAGCGADLAWSGAVQTAEALLAAPERFAQANDLLFVLLDSMAGL